MYQNIPTKSLIGESIISYPVLFNPSEGMNGGEPRYSATFLIPKSDTATINDLRACVEAAKVAAKDKVWKGAVPPNIEVPLYDGDGVTPNGNPFGDECKGHWVLRAKSKNKPHVVSVTNIQGPELLESDVYAGCYVRATVNAYGYSFNGKKGISFGLGNVLKMRDGEPLSGSGASAASDFAGLEQSAPQGVAINPLTGMPL